MHLSQQLPPGLSLLCVSYRNLIEKSLCQLYPELQKANMAGRNAKWYSAVRQLRKYGFDSREACVRIFSCSAQGRRTRVSSSELTKEKS